MPSEWSEGAVAGSVRRFLPDLLTDGIPTDLDPDRPVLVACRTGRRASIAAECSRTPLFQPIVLDVVGVPELIERGASPA